MGDYRQPEKSLPSNHKLNSMALSRIWAAFIIIACSVALYKWIFNGEDGIFNRMVVGKSSDAYDSTAYVMSGSPERSGYTSREGFVDYIRAFGYTPRDSAHQASVIIAEDENSSEVRSLLAANPNARVYSYRSI